MQVVSQPLISARIHAMLQVDDGRALRRHCAERHTYSSRRFLYALPNVLSCREKYDRLLDLPQHLPVRVLMPMTGFWRDWVGDTPQEGARLFLVGADVGWSGCFVCLRMYRPFGALSAQCSWKGMAHSAPQVGPSSTPPFTPPCTASAHGQVTSSATPGRVFRSTGLIA